VKVIVLGAGVIGAAVAAGVASRGHDVHVLEAGPSPAAGTSGTSFAWVNANNKRPEHYHRLNAAAIAEHHRAGGVARGWLVPTGHLDFATTTDHRRRLTDRVERLTSAGYPASFLDRRTAAALEPDLRVAPDTLVGWFPTEAHCYPELFVAHMLGRPGITVETGASVVAVEDGTVRLADGGTRTADHVVGCLGRHTPTLFPGVRLVEPAPGNETVGVIARTAPAPVRLSRVVTTDTVNLRPAGGGALLAHAFELDPFAAPDTPVPARVVSGLRERIEDRVGRPVRIAAAAVGVRPLPADGLPVVGPVGARAYVVVAHSAVTLAPLLGELVARELCVGSEQDRLAPYRPGREAT
jgi:glycine/D-amino acid oxidase-like deaminating enzyme